MLLSLILGNIRIFSCFFFLFLVTLSNLFVIPVVKDKIEVKLAPVILIGAPTTLTDDVIQTTPLVALKTIKILSIQSKVAIYSLNFLLHDFL